MGNDNIRSDVNGTQLPVRTQGTHMAPIKGTTPSVDRLSDLVCRELIKQATEMLAYSYAPYSNFKVGAALMAKNKKVYTGCNVENAAFGPSNCAERTAFFKAVGEGDREFDAIAIVGGKDGKITDYCPPCGVCRQFLSEFGGSEMTVIVAKSIDDRKIYSLGELLPEAFSSESMK